MANITDITKDTGWSGEIIIEEVDDVAEPAATRSFRLNKAELSLLERLAESENYFYNGKPNLGRALHLFLGTVIKSANSNLSPAVLATYVALRLIRSKDANQEDCDRALEFLSKTLGDAAVKDAVDATLEANRSAIDPADPIQKMAIKRGISYADALLSLSPEVQRKWVDSFDCQVIGKRFGDPQPEPPRVYQNEEGGNFWQERYDRAYAAWMEALNGPGYQHLTPEQKRALAAENAKNEADVYSGNLDAAGAHW